jgi:hypothetical protein
MPRQYSHTADVSVYVNGDSKATPSREAFIAALRQTADNFEKKGEDYFQNYVDWGVVMTREDDDDVWVH